MGVIAYEIMAHPARARFVPALVSQLGAGVTWDEKQDRWDTGRRAWLTLADSTAEWGCVIQDDAILCRSFKTVLPKALQHVEGVPVVLYAGRSQQRVWRTVPRGTSWVVLNRIIWGPGIVMPIAMIREVTTYGNRQRIPNYDLRLSKWFERNRVPVYYTWPSLVDHRDSPSLVPGRGAGRRAYRFAYQPHRIDWSAPPWVLDGSRTNLIR
jgi:hypothetical protein